MSRFFCDVHSFKPICNFINDTLNQKTIIIISVEVLEGLLLPSTVSADYLESRELGYRGRTQARHGWPQPPSCRWTDAPAQIVITRLQVLTSGLISSPLIITWLARTGFCNVFNLTRSQSQACTKIAAHDRGGMEDAKIHQPYIKITSEPRVHWTFRCVFALHRHIECGSGTYLIHCSARRKLKTQIYAV